MFRSCQSVGQAWVGCNGQSLLAAWHAHLKYYWWSEVRCGGKIEIKTQSQENTDTIVITSSNTMQLLRLLLGLFLFEMKEHE